MTGDIVNLNKARKTAAKQARKAQAAQNRARYGRTKAETAAGEADADKLTRALDDARRDR